MTEPLSPELLARYFADETTVDERAAVQAWAAESPGNRSELERLRAAWTAERPRPRWDVDRAWTKVAAELEAPRVIAFPKRMTWQHRVLQVAAAVVLIAGAAFAWRVLRPLPVVPMEIAATTFGESRQIELPDGTHVTLAAASRLRVIPGYGRKIRQVELTGEAIFDVHHDEKRPFEVRAAAAIIRDVGTIFSVRIRPGDSAVRVAVVEGIASLRRASVAAADAIVLSAREVGTLTGAFGAVRVDREVNVASLVAWREGRFEYDDSPVSDVVADLSRWYGVLFRLEAPAVAARHLTATLPTASLAEALKVLTLSLGVTVEQRGDTVTVR